MKKIIKISVAVIFCLLILFLLLPFIAPEQNTTVGVQADAQAQQTVSPQIFTSNPLTKIVNRLARLFRGKDKQTTKPEQPQAPLSEAQANARFGTALYPEQPANVLGTESAENPSDQQDSSQQTYASDQTPQNFDENWVLIRQTAPETNPGGMHEINVKENAYDRYVKQERNARFQPVSIKQKQEVPDSKLARIFRPIKKFFGFEDEKQVPATQGVSFDKTASKTGSSDGLGKSRDVSVGTARRGGFTMPLNIGGIGGPISEVEQTKQFFNMLFPHERIRQAAEMIADAAFPNPKNRKEQQQHDRVLADELAKSMGYFNQQIRGRLENLAGNQISGDVAKTFGCGGGAFMSKPGKCPTDSPNIEVLRQQSQIQFKQLTGRNLPKAPIAIILGQMDPEKTVQDLKAVIPELEALEGLDPQKQMLIEKYQFMISQANCSKEDPCFWVANNMPPSDNPSVQRWEDTLEGAGVAFVGDPFHADQKVSNAFLEEIRRNSEDMPDEQREQMLQMAQNAHTPYLLAKASELNKKQEKNIALVLQGFEEKDKSVIKEGCAFLATSGKVALDLNNAGVAPYTFAANNNDIVDLAKSDTTEKRARAVVNALAAGVNFAEETISSIHKESAKKALDKSVTPQVKELKKQVDNQLKSFDKTGNKIRVEDVL